MILFLNGKFVRKTQAKISVFDRGFLYGDGVYETLGTFCGKPFNAGAHIARLFASARGIGLRLPWTARQIERWILEAVRRNGFVESQVRVVVSRGERRGGRPTMVIFVDRHVLFPKAIYEKGVCTVTFLADRSFAHVKALNRLPNVLAHERANAQGCFEAIFVDSNGYVTEGARSNVYMVKDGKIFTPKTDALAGTTRELLGTIARITQRDFRLAELLRADECFVSGSLRRVVPVVRVDGKRIGTGKPGPVTRRLQKGFFELMERMS